MPPRTTSTKRQAQAHRDGIDHAVQRLVLGGKRIGACQHDAVGGDERNENAQHQIERMHECIHRQVDHGDQRRDDEHEHRDADFMRNKMAHARYRTAGGRHHQHGGQAERQGVDHGVADRQQRAQAEQLHQARVLLAETVLKQAAEFIHRHHGWVSFAKAGGGAMMAARWRAK